MKPENRISPKAAAASAAIPIRHRNQRSAVSQSVHSVHSVVPPLGLRKFDHRVHRMHGVERRTQRAPPTTPRVVSRPPKWLRLQPHPQPPPIVGPPLAGEPRREAAKLEVQRSKSETGKSDTPKAAASSAAIHIRHRNQRSEASDQRSATLCTPCILWFHGSKFGGLTTECTEWNTGHIEPRAPPRGEVRSAKCKVRRVNVK